MENFNTILKQLLNFIPRREFENIVVKEQGDRYVKHYDCWAQLTTMLYAQAGDKDSLRDITTALSVHRNHWYHLGITNIARSTLAYTNGHRPYQIYEQLFYNLLYRCHQQIKGIRKFRFKNNLYSLDSTTLDLCLSLFDWAKFRTAKGAIKMHCLHNHQLGVPDQIIVTDGKQSDIKVAKNNDWPLELDSILSMDRGYIDFEYMETLDSKGIYFVTRAKENMRSSLIGQHKFQNKFGVLADKRIKLKGYASAKKYPKELRLVIFRDEKTRKVYRFLTNNFKLASSTIAKIYKSRWNIEIFFKWIKQNLKIKTFLGTSRNAVLTQIWTAMIYLLLLTYIKFQTQCKYSLLEFTRIIKSTIFERKDLIDLLNINLKKLGLVQLCLPGT